MEKILQKEDPKYISLTEATKFCNYSQEYLSLRARRGKLKSVKNGRNWVTTKEWLADYIKTAEDYKKELADRTRNKEIFFQIKTAPIVLSNVNEQASDIDFSSFKKKFISSEKPIIYLERASEDLKEIVPPKNLPVENIFFEKLSKQKIYLSFLKIGFSLGTSFGIFFSVLIFNRLLLSEIFNNGYSSLNNFLVGVEYSHGVFANYFSWLKESSLDCFFGGTCLADVSKLHGLANGFAALLNYFFNL